MVALICALSVTAQAQVIPLSTQMLMPSPLGIIIMVGQWIVKDNKRVYYIRVRGEGPNFVAARQNGLRLAVEQAVGTMVLSETHVRDQRIVRDEIITYAAGFVDRYELVDADYVDRVNRVTMDVWVSESRIANRLLNESVGTGTIDGNRLALQVETLQHERATGDQVLETVLRDFPQRAFDVRVDRTQLEIGSQRNLQIDVPFSVAWNETYLNSLFEGLKRTSTDPVRCWWPSSECTRRERRQFSVNGITFDDMARPAAVVRRMTIDQKPAVELNILDSHGRVLTRTCQGLLFSNMENMPYNVPTRYFFRVNDRNVHVDRSYRVNGVFRLNLGVDVQNLSTAKRIEVRVVSEQQCQQQ